MDSLDFVKVFDLVPHSACDLILNYIENNNLDWQTHSWYSYDSDIIGSYENKELDTCIDELISQFFIGYSTNACNIYQEYMKEIHHDYDIGVSRITPARLNKYSTNTMMRVHSDMIKGIFDGEEKGIPTISILTELSGHQNYGGGEFVICDQEVKLEKGQCIVFPSTFMYPHGVNLVTEGTRYSSISWAY